MHQRTKEPAHEPNLSRCRPWLAQPTPDQPCQTSKTRSSANTIDGIPNPNSAKLLHAFLSFLIVRTLRSLSCSGKSTGFLTPDAIGSDARLGEKLSHARPGPQSKTAQKPDLNTVLGRSRFPWPSSCYQDADPTSFLVGQHPLFFPTATQTESLGPVPSSESSRPRPVNLLSFSLAPPSLGPVLIILPPQIPLHIPHIQLIIFPGIPIYFSLCISLCIHVHRPNAHFS
jgi:hypothetical protein